MNIIESSKPKKQRQYLYSKALHRKQKDLSGHLNKKLSGQLGKRSLRIRKGDTVKVLRGSKKGSEGKVTGVDYRRGVVFIEKLVRKKADGTEIALPVRASNLLIVDVDRSDARRFRRKKAGKMPEPEKAGEKEKGKAAEKEVEKEIGKDAQEKERKKNEKTEEKEKEAEGERQEKGEKEPGKMETGESSGEKKQAEKAGGKKAKKEKRSKR